MPDDWSRPQDIDRLADRDTSVEFDVPLAGFPRLSAEIAANGAGADEDFARGAGEQQLRERRARGHVRVFREDGRATAEVVVSAQLPLRCQRCLGALDWAVDSDARLRLVDAAQETARAGSAADVDVQAQEETYVVERGSVSLPELVEEELLLSLPLIARHEDERDCAIAAAAEPGPKHEERATQSPFAALGEMFKRPQ